MFTRNTPSNYLNLKLLVFLEGRLPSEDEGRRKIYLRIRSTYLGIFDKITTSPQVHQMGIGCINHNVSNHGLGHDYCQRIKQVHKESCSQVQILPTCFKQHELTLVFKSLDRGKGVSASVATCFTLSPLFYTKAERTAKSHTNLLMLVTPQTQD